MSSRDCYQRSNQYVVEITNATEPFSRGQEARRWSATRLVIKEVVEELNQLDPKTSLGTAALMIGYLLDHNPNEGHDLISYLANGNFKTRSKTTRQKRK